jgi:hypothetical protein
MLNYEQKVKHIKDNPAHESFILTSSKFASRNKIIGLAQASGKWIERADGSYIITPFQTSSRILLEEGKDDSAQQAMAFDRLQPAHSSESLGEQYN